MEINPLATSVIFINRQSELCLEAAGAIILSVANLNLDLQKEKFPLREQGLLIHVVN